MGWFSPLLQPETIVGDASFTRLILFLKPFRETPLEVKRTKSE